MQNGKEKKLLVNRDCNNDYLLDDHSATFRSDPDHDFNEKINNISDMINNY